MECFISSFKYETSASQMGSIHTKSCSLLGGRWCQPLLEHFPLTSEKNILPPISSYLIPAVVAFATPVKPFESHVSSLVFLLLKKNIQCLFVAYIPQMSRDQNDNLVASPSPSNPSSNIGKSDGETLFFYHSSQKGVL